jgi:hypothetical protein
MQPVMEGRHESLSVAAGAVSSLASMKNEVVNTTAPTTRTKNEDGGRPLLLSVPFYVYEELLWDFDTSTLGGKPLQQRAGGDGFGGLIEKHANDYWFVHSALRHRK